MQIMACAAFIQHRYNGEFVEGNRYYLLAISRNSRIYTIGVDYLNRVEKKIIQIISKIMNSHTNS